MTVRHFLDIADWPAEEIAGLLELGHRIKVDPEAYADTLRRKTLGMIFQKRSTRTRVSFEVGMFQLGGHALFLSSQDIQIGRGESIADTARVLSRYCDGVMARVYGHDVLEELARYASIPIINGLSDRLHPCQTMADAMTLVEKWSPPGTFDVGVLRGRHLVYVGDGNNMAHSLLNTGAVLGMNVTIVAPRGYWPDLAVWQKARLRARETGATLLCTDDPIEGVRGADVVVTDVWASMGQEEEAAQRLRDFAGFGVDEAMMQRAGPDALFMHCLPAHRGEEVSAEVCDGPRSVIFDEAENRLHAQKAILARLMGGR